MDVGIFEEDDLPPSFPPGLNVLNIRPFFSGDGVRESLVETGGPGEREEPLVGRCAPCTRLLSAPELLRDCSDGLWGSGGRHKSV